jgi:hypothetical protein
VYPLADEFFRLAHNDVTGKPRLHATATGLGLAAALLGELMATRSIDLRDGLIRILDRSPPQDSLAHATLDQLVAQSQHQEVRVWLDFLSRDACEGVAQRLWRAGHVRQETSRRFLRQVVTWVPADVNAAAWPWARLSHGLHHREPLEQSDVFLIGLAAATGLDEDLLEGGPSATPTYLRRLAASAPAAQQELFAYTHAAVGDAVLNYRA